MIDMIPEICYYSATKSVSFRFRTNDLLQFSAVCSVYEDCKGIKCNIFVWNCNTVQIWYYPIIDIKIISKCFMLCLTMALSFFQSPT